MKKIIFTLIFLFTACGELPPKLDRAGFTKSAPNANSDTGRVTVRVDLQ